MRILYNSLEVEQAVKKVFKSTSGRRVAISAFVGDGSDAYLPYPEGIELYCWPTAGGTNPNVLRKLKEKGVEIFFADSVHMKIYWSANSGAVITSANLSVNTLGYGNLKEAGVFLDSKDIDISRLLRSIKPRHASEEEMSKLDRSHNSYVARNRIRIKRTPPPPFEEWYETPFRQDWKLGWWEKTGEISETAKKESMNQFGVNIPNNYVNCKKGEFEEGEWILLFNVDKAQKLEWMQADTIVKISKSDREYIEKYPYQAVQVFPDNRYPPPPFRLKENDFKKAFYNAVRKYGKDKIMKRKRSTPPKKLIGIIYGELSG